MKKVKLPFSYRMVRGAIGKKFVIKHYRYGIIKTRYPDMTGIKVSAAQRVCRDSFREAVVLATKAYRDPEERMMWQKKLRKTTRLFGAMVQAFLETVEGGGKESGEGLVASGSGEVRRVEGKGLTISSFFRPKQKRVRAEKFCLEFERKGKKLEPVIRERQLLCTLCDP